MESIRRYVSSAGYTAIQSDHVNNRRWCWCLIILVLISGCVFIGNAIAYYAHTYVWFNIGLPSPEEVAKWDDYKIYNTLYKLSRWDGFNSGAQFNQFVCAQIRPLGLNSSDKFHFLEVGVGVGAFSLEIMHMFPLSIGTGIDYAPAAIEIAKVVLPLHRMTVKVGDMQKIDSEGSKFHNVFVPGAFCLLFSMDHAYSTMAELERVLKPGGGLCISLLPSETSASVGACNIRIPKKFWLEEMTFRYGFTVLSLEEMDDWHLPHSMGRYNVCLRKPLK